MGRLLNPAERLLESADKASEVRFRQKIYAARRFAAAAVFELLAQCASAARAL